MVIQPLNQKENSGLSTILNIVIGLAVGLAVSIFLILPARIQTETAKVNEKVSEYSEQLSAQTADMQEQAVTIRKLEEQVTQLEADLDAYTGTDGALAAYDQLLDAVQQYMAEDADVMQIADSLGKIDVSYVEDSATENFKNVYHILYTLIGPEVSSAYYQSGLTEYNSGNYTEAINYLKMSVAFNAEDSRALYQLGEAYYKNEDMDQAAECYQQILELFPGSNTAYNAQKRLNTIEGQ